MTESTQKTRSVHIKTFGCQMNVYDSDRMRALLEKQGLRWEPELNQADVILLNTCSIRDKAEHKVLSMLGQLKPLKDRKPNTVLGVSGCLGQRLGRTLLQRVPHLDLVLGPDGIDQVGDLIKQVADHGQRVVEAKFDGPGRRYSQPAVIHRAKPAEYLTIMKGCDHFCTYCIVPFVRGREKSRTIAEIVGDVERVVRMGTKEITFLGQNINTYGKGTPESLAQLIEATNRVKGLERIRYITSHPRDLGQDLIDQFGSVEKLCPALHLPFQSGSNSILKKMSRLYTREEYLSKIEKLRSARADLAFSADVIVGFPGETEEDFEKSLEILREVKFSSIYLFKYSPRPGTKATQFGEAVPEIVKEERLKRAQDLAFGLIDEENRAKVGGIEKVLVESIDKKGRHYTGRSLHNKIVHVLNAGDACVGKILDVEIIESNTSNLRGYYVGAPREARDFENRESREGLSASVCLA